MDGGSPSRIDRRRGSLYLLVSLLVVAFIAAGCGGKDSAHSTYTPAEAAAAFAGQGFTLTKVRDATPAAAIETVFAPQNAEKFAVVVTTDAAAADTWKQYVAIGPDEDSLDVRRANVLAISDGGLTAAQRSAVQAAVAALPDRGADIETLEKR
jgi:hypothetical protein